MTRRGERDLPHNKGLDAVENAHGIILSCDQWLKDTFNPLPDPDPEDIKGTSMKIQYDHRKPWLFKRVND